MISKFTDYATVQSIMGSNLIQIEELRGLDKLNFDVKCGKAIPISVNLLEKKSEEYYLIPGVSKFADGKSVTIRNLVAIFGKNPEVSEPCFYNQDWYEQEPFIDIQMKDEWFFIRKTVFLDSRAVQPDQLIEKYNFPSAIQCAYAFFVLWFLRDVKLWHHDFVWCKDLDHNGDRIYVGKYYDVDGINKNGFSIHRHLALRECYGCIDS